MRPIDQSPDLGAALDTATAAIDLYIEYRDVHGYGEDAARANALADIQDGLSAPGMSIETCPETSAGYVTPGHPAVASAGYDCGCGECLSRRAWLDQGFSVDQAAAWTSAGYATATAAADWTAIGIDSPTVAEEWIDAGFTAQTAAGWVEIENMVPSEAMTCANGGLAPVDVERIRRADPGWKSVEPDASTGAPSYGIDL